MFKLFVNGQSSKHLCFDTSDLFQLSSASLAGFVREAQTTFRQKDLSFSGLNIWCLLYT